MRIISGTLKGRRLKGHDIEGTRPTTDRIKESIFSMIQASVKDAVCLDLFAGSGSLGFEALSNGAKEVYFVDKNIKCINLIKENASTFDVFEKVNIINRDYTTFLKQAVSNNLKFDLIFLDPPYNMIIIEEIVTLIIKNNLLNNQGLIIVETEKNKKQLINENNEILLKKQKEYATTTVSIYQKKKS